MARIRTVGGKPIHEVAPEVLRAEAKRCREREQESFQRSDTDGCLSQWALTMEAQLLDLQASINERGGKASFLALADAKLGEVLTREIEAGHWYESVNGRYYVSDRWVLSREQRQRYGRFRIPCGENSRVQKDLGLHEITIELPAVATIGGSGTGLSGAASAYVTTAPLEDLL